MFCPLFVKMSAHSEQVVERYPKLDREHKKICMCVCVFGGELYFRERGVNKISFFF